MKLTTILHTTSGSRQRFIALVSGVSHIMLLTTEDCFAIYGGRKLNESQ